MKKAWLAIPALALSMGLASPAFAQEEIFHFEDFFKMVDTNKDGMMSRTEFMEAAGRRYDAKMAKMKKMSAEDAKTMMKGDLMTKRGAKTFLEDWKVYSGS